jgi:hypothetical protein
MAPNTSRSNGGSAPNSTPRPVELPPARTTTGLGPLDGSAEGVASPGVVANTEKIDVIGAQRTDPPWWRFVFFLFAGRAGQWWSAVLATVLLVLLLLLTLAGLVVTARLLPGGGWISGGIGLGSLIGGTFLWQRQHR